MCSWEKLGVGLFVLQYLPGLLAEIAWHRRQEEAKETSYFIHFQPKTSCGSGWLHQSCIGHIGRLYFPWPKCPLSGALPGQTAHCFERYERVGAKLYVTVLHLSLCSSKAHFTTKTNVQIHKCFFYREEKNRDLNGIALKPKFCL